MHPQQVQNFAQHSDAFASSCWEPPLILTYHIAAAVQIPKLQIATAEGMAGSESTNTPCLFVKSFAYCHLQIAISVTR